MRLKYILDEHMDPLTQTLCNPIVTLNYLSTWTLRVPETVEHRRKTERLGLNLTYNCCFITMKISKITMIMIIVIALVVIVIILKMLITVVSSGFKLPEPTVSLRTLLRVATAAGKESG